MYCRHCGKEIDDNLVKCNYCDEKVITERILRDRDSSILWGILTFMIPLIGIPLGIGLFLAWIDKKPYSAKAALIGGFLDVILIFLIIILPLEMVYFLGVLFG